MGESDAIGDGRTLTDGDKETEGNVVVVKLGENDPEAVTLPLGIIGVLDRVYVGDGDGDSEMDRVSDPVCVSDADSDGIAPVPAGKTVHQEWKV